ncbi:MAG TPA: TatD family hydrolase [Opitutaceae bacterium]|nr:TatD family hydrolase [Opitutaceae bacterium]
MLIDTHTHLESFARNGGLPGMLERARSAGVAALVTIGTDTDDWELYRGIAAEHPGFVRYTVGLHPCSVGEDWADRVERIEDFWQEPGPDPRAQAGDGGAGDEARREEGGPKGGRPRPVAVGETGLDRFHLPKDDATAAARIFGWQRDAFAAQMRAATRLGCPLVVHSRGAFRECIEMIDAAGFDWTKVVFHCFSEGAGEMHELVRRGGRGSFTGIITYRSAEAVRAAALAQGLDRLMLETDAPYLTPLPHRGKPNEVSYIRHTAEFCAPLFGVSLERLGEITSQNARRFFGL